jgi:hypothetical protein
MASANPARRTSGYVSWPAADTAGDGWGDGEVDGNSDCPFSP